MSEDQKFGERVIQNVERVIIGKRAAITHVSNALPVNIAWRILEPAAA